MTVSVPLDDNAARCRYRAYGIEFACDFPLPGGIATPDVAGPARTIAATARSAEVVESLWSGSGEVPLHEAVLSGDTRLTIERGGAGDHLIRCGEHAFHLSAGLGLLTCAPPAAAGADWQRALLDWVAYSAAVLAGTQCLHASAVELDGRVIALAAASGGGKTTLAAELVAAGATFFCDDVLALALHGGRVVAHPGAPFASVDRRRRRFASHLGTARGVLGDELWVSIGRPARAAAPIAAVVALDRREGGPEEPLVEAMGFMALRDLAIGFAREGGREERRFSILAALAEQAPLLRLEASSSTPARALARATSVYLEAGGVL